VCGSVPYDGRRRFVRVRTRRFDGSTGATGTDATNVVLPAFVDAHTHLGESGVEGARALREAADPVNVDRVLL